MLKKMIMFMLPCLLFTTMVLAKPASVTETSTATVNSPSPGFDKLWVDDDGVQHARGWIIPAQIFGGAAGEGGILLGTQLAYLDWNIDLATQNGDFHGTFEREWTVKGVSGIFVGRFQATIMGGAFQGTSSAKGSGGFQGMKFNGIFAGIWRGGGRSGTGRILDPSGDF